jgi:uncharacterized protein YndB with AHSA1/START domain
MLICAIALVAMVLFSPYSRTEVGIKKVAHTISIDAPVEVVFDYLGSSSNASKWSVFVHHITTLNDSIVPDGAVGSVRRCFVNADEKGRCWDEETVRVVPNHSRRLTIFNMQDFPLTADHLVTEQLYRKTAEDQCELTFTVFYDVENPGLASHLKLYFAAYRIQRIFKQNMKNIKQNVEEIVRL